MIYEAYATQRKTIIHPDISIPVLERLPLLREYVKLVGMVDVEFESALYSEYDVEDNPKKEMIFKFAKKWAYPPEYYDIENIFSDMVELIK